MSNQEPINTFSSRIVVLPEANIDTDQIIPARFLTTTTKAGLGKVAFNDWRYNADGSNKPHILNQIDANEHRVLVAGNNLGCGSSREHAPWALMDYGFKAVISTEIADIFKSNSLKNGLLPIVVDQPTYDKLIKNPQRSAGFRVLRAPDVPSVLVELGYLSNTAEEAQLCDPAWRDKAAGSIASAIAIFARARTTAGG